MALQTTAFHGQTTHILALRQSRRAAREPARARASSSPTRPPPAKPMRRPFSSPLPQFQRLWAVKRGKETAQHTLEQRAEGRLCWADGLEEHYRTGKTVGRGALASIVVSWVVDGNAKLPLRTVRSRCSLQ